MRILGSAHHRTRRAFVVSRAFVLGLFDRSFRARRRVTARTRHAPAVTRLRVRFVLNHAIAFRRSSRHGSGFTRASKRRIARPGATARRLTSIEASHGPSFESRSRRPSSRGSSSTIERRRELRRARARPTRPRGRSRRSIAAAVRGARKPVHHRTLLLPGLQSKLRVMAEMRASPAREILLL